MIRTEKEIMKRWQYQDPPLVNIVCFLEKF